MRLAETWKATSTKANEQVVSASRVPNLTIPDGNLAGISDTITLASGLQIDHVEVDLDISHTYIGDLRVTLTSPTGVESVLVDRPLATSSDPFGSDADNIDFTFSTTHDWGETGVGNWTLSVFDLETLDAGTLNSWSLRLYGDAISTNNTYVYTNEFANFTGSANAARRTLSDSSGTDTINAAAITSNSVLNLTSGTTSTLAGNSLTISSGNTIEHAIGGDGNDSITGNSAINQLTGGRGADILDGGTGNDSLFGGAGNDTLKGNTGNDFVDGGSGNDSVTGGSKNDTLVGGSGNDQLTGALDKDKFLYDTGRAFVKADVGRDTITDLDRKAGSTDTVFDQIVLDKETFTSLASVAGVGFSVAGEFKTVTSDTAAATSTGEIIYNSANDKLFYNQNGAGSGFGTGDLFATLTGITSLVAADFLIQA